MITILSQNLFVFQSFLSLFDKFQIFNYSIKSLKTWIQGSDLKLIFISFLNCKKTKKEIHSVKKILGKSDFICIIFTAYQEISNKIYVYFNVYLNQVANTRQEVNCACQN